MSRPPRAGTAGKPVTIRATDAERALWQAATEATGGGSLSDALRPAITAWAAGVVGARRARRLLGGGRR
jgi:hypothetical protein